MASHPAQSLMTPITPSMPICAPTPTGIIDSLPISPPDSSEPFREKSTKLERKSLRKVLHVLATERDALSHLEALYTSSSTAQTSLISAISHILSSQAQGGKVIFTGVGKSGWIAQKLVATFNSVGIVSVFLHPTEALHGDLGMIRSSDVIIMTTYSGRTPELLTLLRHIPTSVPLVVMSSHVLAATCPLLNNALRSTSNSLLLPAPVHITEKEAFGLSAPTSSTTVALALGDGLALAIADRMHTLPGSKSADVFARHHPGGAIGAAIASTTATERKMSDLAIHIEDIPVVYAPNTNHIRCLDVLLTAVRSPKGWVRVSPVHMISPRRCQQLSNPEVFVNDVEDDKGTLVVEQTDWISIPGDCRVEECKQWIMKMRTEGDGRGKEFLRPGTILGIVDNLSQKSGVVEIEDVVGEDFCGTL